MTSYAELLKVAALESKYNIMCRVDDPKDCFVVSVFPRTGRYNLERATFCKTLVDRVRFSFEFWASNPNRSRVIGIVRDGVILLQEHNANEPTDKFHAIV